jgi:hypothetical protein
MLFRSFALSLLFAGSASAMRPPGLASESWTTPEAAASGVVVAPVRGAVKLRLRSVAAQVEVVSGPAGSVTVRLRDSEVGKVTVEEQGGDRIELRFDGAAALKRGKVGVRVPLRSDVEVVSAGGDVDIDGVGGAARVQTQSGDVRVRGADTAELHTISGDVELSEVAGEARIETVSGDAKVSGVSRLRYTSTSGDLVWGGGCAARCRVEARTLSGDVALRLGSGSSFDVRYLTHTGEVSDEVGVEMSPPAPGREVARRGRYQRGDGLIEIETWSGDLAMLRGPGLR